MRNSHVLVWLAVLLTATGANAQEADDAVPGGRRAQLIAQREAKAQELRPEEVGGWERRFRSYETRPWLQKLTVKGYRGVRALIGGFPPSSGFVGGLGYAAGRTSDVVLFDAQARISTKNFRRAEASFAFPGPALEAPWFVSLHGRYRDYPELRFHGIEPDGADESTFYGREDRRAGVSAGYTRGWIGFDSDVSILNAGIRSSDRDPQIADRFDPATVPGSSGQADWVHYRGDVDLRFLDAGYPHAGVVVKLGADRYEGRDVDGFDFTRLRGEVQLHLPLGVRSRRLAARIRTAHDMPDGGSRVPFFLMETIGGATSLRGYEQYRFQDVRNLLVNLEYRWEVWTFADATVFTDAGKVFDREGELNFRGLKSTWGFGFRVHAPGIAPFRIALARAVNQTKIHIGSGPDF